MELVNQLITVLPELLQCIQSGFDVFTGFKLDFWVHLEILQTCIQGLGDQLELCLNGVVHRNDSIRILGCKLPDVFLEVLKGLVVAEEHNQIVL